MGSGRRLQVSIANSVQSGAVAVDILLCHRHVLHRNIACQVRGRKPLLRVCRLDCCRQRAGFMQPDMSKKNRTPITFSNISNKFDPLLIIFGTKNNQFNLHLIKHIRIISIAVIACANTA